MVGEAGNGAGLLALLATTPADMVLIDINVPMLDDFEIMPEYRYVFLAPRLWC